MVRAKVRAKLGRGIEQPAEYLWSFLGLRITSSSKEKDERKRCKNGDREWMVRSDRYEKR